MRGRNPSGFHSLRVSSKASSASRFARSPIAFTATDTRSTFQAGAGEPVVAVSAPASDLVLLLYGRVSPDDVAVDGDRTALDAFLFPIG